jgi:hypothetical protein
MTKALLIHFVAKNEERLECECLARIERQLLPHAAAYTPLLADNPSLLSGPWHREVRSLILIWYRSLVAGCDPSDTMTESTIVPFDVQSNSLVFATIYCGTTI